MGHGIELHTSVDVKAGALRRARELLRGAPERVSEHRAHVGILEDDGGEAKLDYYGKPTDATLASAEMIQEFNGRSWLRTWFDQNKDRLGQQMTASMRAEYQGDKSAVRDLVGSWPLEIRSRIMSGDADLKALTPETIAAKQKAGLSHPDTPLVATGQFLEAIKALLDGSPA